MPTPVIFPGDAGYTTDQIATLDALAGGFRVFGLHDTILGYSWTTLPRDWDDPITSTHVGMYNSWIEQLQSLPQSDFCRMFGFNVDVAASCSLGFGKIFSSDPSTRAPWEAYAANMNPYPGALSDIPPVRPDIDAALQLYTRNMDPHERAGYTEVLTLSMLYQALNDYWQWGPAWLADQLKAFWSPPSQLSQLRSDLQQGRLQFKFLFRGNSISTLGRYSVQDPVTLVMQRAVKFFSPTCLAPTDHSLTLLLGQVPDRNGDLKASPQTTACLIISGMTGGDIEGNDAGANQLENIIRPSGILKSSDIDRWASLDKAMQGVWVKQNGAFEGLDAAFSTFQATLNRFVSVNSEILQTAALFTSLAIRMTALFGTLAVSLVAPQIGIPAAILITTGVSVIAAAATGQQVNAGSIVLGTAGSIAAVAGANAGTVATVTTAATAIQTGGSNLDIGGINVGVSSSALAPLAAAAQSIAPDIGSPLANILPASTLADLSQAAGSVSVAPSAPQPNTVAPSPVATAKPGAVTNSLSAKLAAVKPSTWGAVAAAAYYLMR